MKLTKWITAQPSWIGIGNVEVMPVAEHYEILRNMGKAGSDVLAAAPPEPRQDSLNNRGNSDQECTCIEDSGAPVLCPACRAALERLFDTTDPLENPAPIPSPK